MSDEQPYQEQPYQEQPLDERLDEQRDERLDQQRAELRADQPQVEPLAITVGAAIPAATTIDALFSALYATRSADITAAGVPTYSWGGPSMIVASWPALQAVTTPQTPNYSAMFCRFEARSVMGSQIAQ